MCGLSWITMSNNITPIAEIEEPNGVEFYHVAEELNDDMRETDYRFVGVINGPYYLVEYGTDGPWELVGTFREAAGELYGDTDPAINEFGDDYLVVDEIGGDRYIVNDRTE